MSVTPDASAAPLTRFEKVGLILFGLVVVAFGGLVLWRSAFQNDRKTDFGVYARAAFAVRTGLDIYHKDTCDDRGWHYTYPPPFAIVMVPLADPYVWDDRTGYLPWWALITVWYALSIGLLAYSVHALAKAVLPEAQPGSRRWWYARTVPVYVCLAGIGATLSRGQVNTLMVALLVAMFVVAVRGRSMVSGMWLAAAIALKVIPGLMLLYPLARRDWRAGVGVGVGLLLLLGVLPVCVWGFQETRTTYEKYFDGVLLPGLTGMGDQTRARELTDGTATDSQSFQAILHNWQHPDRADRPEKPGRVTRLTHWAIGGVLIAATLIVAGRRPRGAADELIVFGCLCALMTLMTPVSHVHYYAFVLPLVAGLWLHGLAERPGAISSSRRVLAVLIVWGLLTGLTMLPYEWTKWARDMGIGVFATVGLWAVGVTQLARAAWVGVVPTDSFDDSLPDVPGWEQADATRRPAA